MTGEDDVALQRLLRRAGRRAAPPDLIAGAVYLHTRRAWHAQVQRRQALHRGYAWAAGIAAMIIASWGAWNLIPHRLMATAPQDRGLLISRTLWHPFAGRRGGELFEGDAVQSGAQGAVLHRADGSEMSLGGHTRLSFVSRSEVRLWSGRLYVHTYRAARAADLVVLTDLGSIEHLGTQFLVDREPGSLLVAVREGRVAMHYVPDTAVELQQGQAARIDPRGDLQRWNLAAFDDLWDWADALAMPMDIDGQSLYSVLNRIADRSGLRLRFSTPQAESQARTLALHGAPLQLQPRYALSAVLATTSLSGTADGREILVSAREGR